MKINDPYGISLLDLLSNALGAAILLFLIVSVGNRGSQDQTTDALTNEGDAKESSLQIGKPGDRKDTLYMFQIDLYNTGKTSDSLSVDDTSNWLVYHFDSDDMDTLSLNEQGLHETYLVKQKINDLSEDGFELTINRNIVLNSADDTICITAFNTNVPKVCDCYSMKITDKSYSVDGKDFFISIWK